MEKKLSYEALEHRVKELEQRISTSDSESQVLKYFSIARVMFVALDTKGNITFINECSLETLGYRKEELIGQNWFKTCLPEQFQEDILSVYHQLMANEIEPVEYHENPVLRKDGTERIIAWHNAILKDSDGDIIGALSSGNDITDRKKIEAELKQAKEEWEQTFDAVPDLIMIIDNNHRIVRANKAMADRAGMTAEEMAGQPCYEIAHGTDKPPGFCPHTLLLKDHQHHFAEIREERMGGDFIVTVSPITILKDGLTGSVHVAHDITQRKKAEEILAAKNRFMEIIKKEQPIIDLKNWNLRKDGTRVCLLTNGVPIFDGNGKFTGYRGVGKDITRELEIEEKLKRSLEITEKIIENVPIG